MFTECDLREMFVNYIRTHYKVKGDLTDDMELVRSGIIDSFGVVQIVSFIEDELGIDYPDELLIPENFSSIKMLSRCLFSLQVESL